MSELKPDAEVISVLMERFNKQRLPRALGIKERLDQGEKLSDADMTFLEHVLADARKLQPMVERHPEHQQLVVKAISLYHEIVAKAAENET